MESTELLSPSGPCFGRQAELAAAQALLEDDNVRLVTLIGPGGVGKTRLAFEIVASLEQRKPWRFVAIAGSALCEAEQLIASIAQRFDVGSSDESALIAGLRAAIQGPTLLLLDNLEHLLDAVPQLSRIQRAVPQLRILATSRAPLRISGERSLTVAPLALPDCSNGANPEQLLLNPAVALFVERARAADASFRFDASNALTIAKICIELDGLPLAIELAAARAQLLGSEALLDRLDQRLQLLTTGDRDLHPRQQTLRATIDWSYDLLSPQQQLLFAKCSVFLGSFSLADAEAIAGEDQLSALDGLSALVEQSLLQRSSQSCGSPRFVMLATIRAYALERLNASQAYLATKQKHCDYYTKLAEQNAELLDSDKQQQAMQEIQLAYDNLRAVLLWANSRNDARLLLRLVAALYRFWEAHDLLDEGQRWASRALELAGRDSPPKLLGQAQRTIGTLARHQSDYPRAQLWLERALAAWQASGDQCAYASTLCELGEVAFRLGKYAQAERYFCQSRSFGQATVSIDALNGLGRAIWMQGDRKRAETLQHEALDLSRSCNYIRGTAWALNALGEIARANNEWQAAERYFQASASSFQQIGDQGAERLVEQNLAFVLLACKQTSRAYQLFLKALHQWRVGGARHAMALSLIGLAGVCSQQSQAELAAQLIGAAQQRLALSEIRLEQSDQADYQRIVEAVEAQLGKEHCLALSALGQHSDLDELVKAIAQPEQGQLSEPQKPAFGLTARESEVLALLAEGLTNAQIAEHLTISPYTVNIHIRSIFGKLGVTTRAAATRRALEWNLVA